MLEICLRSGIAQNKFAPAADALSIARSRLDRRTRDELENNTYGPSKTAETPDH